jgi:hypothetical protein
VYIDLQENNAKQQNKYGPIQSSKFISLVLFLLFLLFLLRLNECNTVCSLAVYFGCSDHFDKISIRAIPVKIVKSMTTAKDNGGALIIPLHRTSTG